MEENRTRVIGRVRDRMFGTTIVESIEPCTTGEWGFKHYVSVSSTDHSVAEETWDLIEWEQ